MTEDQKNELLADLGYIESYAHSIFERVKDGEPVPPGMLHRMIELTQRVDAVLYPPPSARGPYEVAVFFNNDYGTWSYHDSWTGVASSPEEAKKKALDALEDTRIEFWRAEVLKDPDNFNGEVSSKEDCLGLGCHLDRRDEASGCCYYCLES